MQNSETKFKPAEMPVPKEIYTWASPKAYMDYMRANFSADSAQYRNALQEALAWLDLLVKEKAEYVALLEGKIEQRKADRDTSVLEDLEEELEDAQADLADLKAQQKSYSGEVS